MLFFIKSYLYSSRTVTKAMKKRWVEGLVGSERAWGGSSLGECLLGIFKALNSIPGTIENR